MPGPGRFLLLHGLLLLLCTAVTSAGEEGRETVWNVDFQTTPPGIYTPERIRRDWPQLAWQELLGRAEIILPTGESGNRVLRVRYPAGGIGPQQSGGQFLVPIPAAEEYYLQYRVFFEPGFDFAKGGKLPGLTGGGSKATGGRPPRNGEGWSARYMWRRGGAAVVYLYYPDQKDEYGEDQPLQTTFQPGRWYLLTQHIVVNHPNRSDALLEVWINGKAVFRRDNFRLRIRTRPLIDTFYFSTFHGGDTPDFAPKNDSFARFDNFYLSKTPPQEIAPALQPKPVKPAKEVSLPK